jgi:hypothetical protein
LLAIISRDVESLCAYGHDLLRAPDPDTALRSWLHAFAVHASTMNGLLATQLAVDFRDGDGNALAACHVFSRSPSQTLISRSQPCRFSRFIGSVR